MKADEPYAVLRAVDFIDRWLDFNIRHRSLPGCIVGISHAKKTVLRNAYGKSNIYEGTALTPDDLFPVASQSKMFTATLIQLLAANGTVALDSQIAEYLPWVKAHPSRRVSQITVKQLLWHGSGLLRDGKYADFWQLRGTFPNDSELQKQILSTEPVLTSGQKTKYSDLGYALLGQVIQSVTGLSYSEAVRMYITEPLGMSRTYTEAVPDTQPISLGYTRPMQGKRLAVPAFIATNAFASVTGIYSSVDDMLYFMESQLSGPGSILPIQNTLQLHGGCRNHWVPAVDRGTDFGFGFMNYEVATGTIVGHSGSFLGHRSCSFIDKQNELAVAIMLNSKDAPLMDILFGIYHIWDYFLKHATNPTDSQRARFNGRLSALWGDRELVATNDQIVNVYLDEWMPFDSPEKLEIVNQDTLKIVETSDLMSEHELVHVSFENDEIVGAVYAGTTLMRPQAYYDWVRYNWPLS